jgi:hypothetical protein
MAGDRQVGEREYLREVTARVEALLVEVGRVNRRLRNARTAVHALEDELARLCEEVTARVDGLGERLDS